jgi:hypothetical protein
MKKLFLPSIVVLLASAACLCGCAKKEPDSISGATPLALDRPVPDTFSIAVKGNVKKELLLTGSSLNALAKTRIRTREVSSSGEYLGAYAYDSVPVFNLLEGIAPDKPDDAAFDRPLDMIITFIAENGDRRHFSYGELTMSDDSLQVALAYHREQVLPTKDPRKYGLNRFRSNISGFRLICPREPDTARYLDNVTAMILRLPDTAGMPLPVMKKGHTCHSKEILCLAGGKSTTAGFDAVEENSIAQWVRVGHGRGYKGISKATGYGLRSFLRRNFPALTSDKFFLCVACDGYRVILSGREIFMTEQGDSFLLLGSIDGKDPRGGYMLAPVKDFFVDRDVWGLSHIIMLNPD